MDLLRAGGQKFRIQTRCNPMFYDPDDPDPDDIEYEEDEHVPFYERDYESKRSTKIRLTDTHFFDKAKRLDI